MNTYKFSGLPTHSSVAATVTLLVCAWFALAGGAILTDQHSAAIIESARAAPAAYTEIPDAARLTIVVEAKRLAA